LVRRAAIPFGASTFSSTVAWYKPRDEELLGTDEA
jgi:hypothetical protein